MEAGWRTIATPRPSWQPASRPRPPAAITWSSCAGRTAFAARTILVQIFACPEREIEASFPPAYLLHAGGAKPGPKPHMAMSLTAQNQIEPDSSESFRGLEPIYILGIARMAWTYSPLRDGTALRRFAMILSACAPQHATRCNRLAVPRGPPAASPAGFPNPTTTALRRGSPPVRCPKRQAWQSIEVSSVPYSPRSAFPNSAREILRLKALNHGIVCHRLAIGWPSLSRMRI